MHTIILDSNTYLLGVSSQGPGNIPERQTLSSRAIKPVVTSFLWNQYQSTLAFTYSFPHWDWVPWQQAVCLTPLYPPHPSYSPPPDIPSPTPPLHSNRAHYGTRHSAGFQQILVIEGLKGKFLFVPMYLIRHLSTEPHKLASLFENQLSKTQRNLLRFTCSQRTSKLDQM